MGYGCFFVVFAEWRQSFHQPLHQLVRLRMTICAYLFLSFLILGLTQSTDFLSTPCPAPRPIPWHGHNHRVAAVEYVYRKCGRPLHNEVMRPLNIEQRERVRPLSRLSEQIADIKQQSTWPLNIEVKEQHKQTQKISRASSEKSKSRH